ncbi:MAG: hypothetical protein HYW96_01155 [Candidatus Wildermuthbacteria bacterium]|nr:hypothetical protein [Candidatus Wildermuthbacteria bacterium]
MVRIVEEEVRPVYRRIAPHAAPVHIDEYMAAALIRRFSAQAEKRWAGIGTAEFLPLSTLDDWPNLRVNSQVLKLGWGGRRGESFNDVVDEHTLPDEERKGQCTTTLVAELLDLGPVDRFLIKPAVKAALDSDKRGRQAANALDLADLVMAPLTNGDTHRFRLEVVTWALKVKMGEQQRFLNAAEKLKPKETWNIPGPKGLVAVHVLNYADSSEFEQFEDAVTAVCRIRGAKMVVIRNPDGHIQVIRDPEKRLPMEDVALSLRAYECHMRGRKLPPLAELRRRGTIPEVPEWHFSDSGNVLNGGEAQPHTTATLLQLENVAKTIEHAFDPAWMKAHGFA